MRIEQLQYLLDIKETHSITHTAERFFVTQQAVSSSLKRLEQEMGAVLLERKPSDVQLTEQGKLAAEFAKRVMEDLEQTIGAIAQMDMMEAATAKKRCLRIGSASALNNVVMPKVFNVLQQRGEPLEINIVEMPVDRLFDEVLEGKCDVAFISMNTDYIKEQMEQRQQAADRLRCKSLMRDKLLACMSSKSSYAKQDKITKEQISSHTKTLYHITPIERYKEEAYEQSIICSNDLELHKRMLLQNDIFTLMTQMTYQTLFKSKKLTAKPIELEEKVEITHGILYRVDADEVIHDFITLVEECMRRL